LGQNKKCPECRSKQAQFIKGADSIVHALRIAEDKYNNFKLTESEELQNLIFASIFGSKNLLKVAQEQEQNTNLEQSAPEVTEQPAQQEDTAFVDAASNQLAHEIASAFLEVGLNENVDGAAAQVLNKIFADSTSSNIKLAQANAASSALSKDPRLNYYEAASKYATGDTAMSPYNALVYKFKTPEAARKAEELYDRYVSTYGTDFLIMLPEWDPNPDVALRNQQENLRRLGIRESYISEFVIIVNFDKSLIDYAKKHGLAPGYAESVIGTGNVPTSSNPGIN